jgi:hypothetical protein
MSLRPRIVAIAVLAVFVLAALALAIKSAQPPGIGVVRTHPIAFTLHYPASMHELPPARGELLHLQRKGRDDFIVEQLKLPPYQGDVGGALPVIAARELNALRKRYPELQPVEETKTRVNRVVGYTLSFQASQRPRLYGRLVLLPEPVPGTRDGVKMLLLATPSGGAAKAEDVGAAGRLKTPYRSFRFGIDGA